MPHTTPQSNKHDRSSDKAAATDRLVRGVRQLLNTIMRRETPHNGFTNPFEAALHSSDDFAKALVEHSVVLTPLIKRHAFDDFEGVPGKLRLGWAQLPQTKGQAFSLGVFADDRHFSQIAIADSKGRVFVGADPTMDVQGREPRFMFAKEDELSLPDDARLVASGHEHTRSPKASGRGSGRDGNAAIAQPTAKSSGESAGKSAMKFIMRSAAKPSRTVKAVQGGVAGRDTHGRMIWLASWLKRDNRYTLEQMRADLPKSMRFNLEYRDAIAIAFFAAYMLPQMNGLLIGFGSGNIFRRLNREAPMGAIRRSVRDSMAARAHGMRASGLEDHFADLMREAGALDQTPGLEAVHGAEPMHLYTSSYSGSYFFSWDSSMPFEPALKALRIEGNLNRFSAVSSWLEHNARHGLQPTEDTVTRAQAAQIDAALLEHPALIALPRFEDEPTDMPKTLDGLSMPSANRELDAVSELIRTARMIAGRIAAGTWVEENEGPKNPTQSTHTAAPGDAESPYSGSEWVYRQTLALLLRSLRLPFRYDVEFRSNISEGAVAVGFTAAGVSMMPSSRYDEKRHTWTTYSEDERAAMCTDYNLRVGMMMAALAFGASKDVDTVSMHIDSIGLEEAVAEQDSAISKLMSEALSAFERMHAGDISFTGGKADPKDGDLHGDPTRAALPPVRGIVDMTPPSDGVNASGAASDSSAESSSSADNLQDMNEVNRNFEDLMRDFDFDEMSFAASATNGEDAAAEGVQSDTDAIIHDAAHADTAAGNVASENNNEDPLAAFHRNPTVHNIVSVTFTRDEFLRYIGEHGLDEPLAAYRVFHATLNTDEHGALQPVESQFELRDNRFSPAGSQEEPELSEQRFSAETAAILGTSEAVGLSIQRADLLQRATGEFHRLAANGALSSAEKAQQAMYVINAIADPELTELAPKVTSALIDGADMPDFTFHMSDDLDAERLKARDMLFSGQLDASIEYMENAVESLDHTFEANPGVPRYFNSYAERVVYNHLFATEDERTVIIPDNLFYAHMELADLLAQLKGPQAALKHLNAMVSYAPSYPLSHLKLAVQLARSEDWNSAGAACLNALRVALDRDDAAYAYYRFAYSAWMRDQFDIAAAAYIMCDHIAPGRIAMLESELQELFARAESQCIDVPTTPEEAMLVLRHNDLPIWPDAEVSAIVDDAAHICVDEGMFVPARTLTVASSRIHDIAHDGTDVVQSQFLRSLNN